MFMIINIFMFAKLRRFSGRRQSFCPFLPRLALALGRGRCRRDGPRHPRPGEGTVGWLGCVCVVPVTSLEGRVSLASGSGWPPGVRLLCPVKGWGQVLLWGVSPSCVWAEEMKSRKPVCGESAQLLYVSCCEWQIQFLSQLVRTEDQEFT